MQNAKLREKMRRFGVRHYQVAAALGVSENTFCRRLRTEFSDEERAATEAAIDRLVAERLLG